MHFFVQHHVVTNLFYVEVIPHENRGCPSREIKNRNWHKFHKLFCQQVVPISRVFFKLLVNSIGR